MLRNVRRAVAMTALAAIALPFAAFAHEQATFSVKIENVATSDTLKLPDGKATNAPIAPGMYAVVADGTDIFVDGKPTGDFGLEALAEDGNFEPILAHIKEMSGVRAAGMFVPGQSFEFIAKPGDHLVFGTMFVQSNDLFFAPAAGSLPLFDASARPITGDRTSEVRLWDAGTEVNEQPGAGPDQAPRQPAANTGTAENGVVHPVGDGFQYPATDAVIRVTIGS